MLLMLMDNDAVAAVVVSIVFAVTSVTFIAIAERCNTLLSERRWKRAFRPWNEEEFE